jgi:hypothetical protein
VSKRLAIAGSGAIACGLAATAAHHGPVLLLARSESSADRARATVEKTLSRLQAEVDPEHVEIVTDSAALAEATFVVEAVIEDHDAKAALLTELNGILDEDAILASTTSSLSIERLAQESGRPRSFVGLHVFNPVTKMQLVELVFPSEASAETRRRAHELCEKFDAGGSPGRAGLRRQPAAVPVSVQRGAPGGRDGHGPGGRGHVHAPGRGAPDGAAGAAGPGWAGCFSGDRRDDRRAGAGARAGAGRRRGARTQEWARNPRLLSIDAQPATNEPPGAREGLFANIYPPSGDF